MEEIRILAMWNDMDRVKPGYEGKSLSEWYSAHRKYHRN